MSLPLTPTPSNGTPAPRPLKSKLVAAWLGLFVESGSVVELRALDCKKYPGTRSGYYDSDHLSNMAEHGAAISTIAERVCFTFNPVNPDLLARSANVTREAKKGESVSATDVVRRRWLMIDVDPERPSGVSSTDAEKAAAREVAEAVASHLAGLGWPAPLLCDSGNGWHLFYRVDLPNDDGGLCGRVLASLAGRFSTDAAKVDRQTHDANRMAKVYGTLAAKGSHTHDRPHRVSAVVAVPACDDPRDPDRIAQARVEVVPVELLEAVAGPAPTKRPAPSPRPGVRTERRLKVPEWLRDNGAEFAEGDCEGGRKFVLAACPFNPDHKGTSAAILQFSSGATSFHCFHDSCSGRTWEDAKRAIGEPDDDHWDPPRTAQDRCGPGRQPAAPAGADPGPGGAGDYHRTDMGNARRLVDWHGENLLYVGTWEKWLVWQGDHWRLDETCRVPELAQRTAARMHDEAAAALRLANAATGTEEAAKKAAVAHANAELAWAFNSQMSGRLSAMATTAEPLRAITHGRLDRDGFALPCLNGTIDLRTGNLRESRRQDFLTKLCPHDYNPAAKCPAWEAALLKIFGGDADLVDYFRRVVGYCLTGSVEESIVVILHGGGSNGKSLVMGVLQKVIGDDYAGVGPNELLRSDHEQGHPTAFAGLFGMRLVTLAETSESGRLNETLIKKLSGGDRVQARRMREDFWEFDPTHKIMLATNHLPRISGTDHGIWRRLRLVPFNVRFWDPDKKESGPPELKADKDLKTKLEAEMPGILAWAVRGCLEWRRAGLAQPEAVTRATSKYRAEQDIVAGFIDDCCRLGDGLRVAAKPLYLAYRKWHEDTGRENKPMSLTIFGGRLKEREDLLYGKVEGVMTYKGIGLIARPSGAFEFGEGAPDSGEAGILGDTFSPFPKREGTENHAHSHTGNREKVSPSIPASPEAARTEHANGYHEEEWI